MPTGGAAHIGKHLKTLRQKCPSSVPLMLLTGHYLMSQVRSQLVTLVVGHQVIIFSSLGY